MKRVWAALTAMAFLTGTAAPALAANDCKMVKVAELPVRFDRNRPRVEIEINGKPVWFLVDTGASSSLMWGGVAQKLGLSFITASSYGSQITFYGVGGAQDAEYVIVKDFQIGSVKAKDFRIFAIGRGGSFEEGGILGRDFWGHWDLEIDLAAKTLRLWSPQNCGDQSLAYWTKEPDVADLRQGDAGDPYLVRIAINGRAVEATLDSGAGVSIITDDLARRVGVTPKDYVGKASQGMGIAQRAFETHTAQLDKVTIGAEQISHPKIVIADMFGADRASATGSILAHRVEAVRTDMLLGADFLRSHRVLLAPGQHRVYFTYNGGPVFEVVGDAAAPETGGVAGGSKPAASAAPAPVAPGPSAR